MSIRILDDSTAGKIAAGEVITDPGAVVKELLENAIDARSSKIDIMIEEGGKKKIVVSDNGEGIISSDVSLAFKRHATSKITQLDDLVHLDTLGFRGEALASIASISRVSMKTQSHLEEIGTEVMLKNEKMEIKQKSLSIGTTIMVEDLFYNTPARFKHQKKASDLNREIIDLVQKIALSHPEVSFSMMSENRSLLRTPGDNHLLNCIYTIYGKEFVDHLVSIHYQNDPLEITGFLGKPTYMKSTRLCQYITINHRFIQDVKIAKAVEEAYENTIMINKHPVFILNIQIPSHMLDVNVHPSKTKIRMLNESLILLLIKDGIRKKIREKASIPKIPIEKVTSESVYEEHQQQSMNSVHKPDIRERLTRESTIPYKEDGRIHVAEIQEEKKDQDAYKKFNQFSSFLANCKLVAQIFDTYILFEGEDCILLIDQHAAHERVLYEDIRIKIKNGEKITQNIFPYHMKCSPGEYQILMDEKKCFENIGFDYDEFGNNTICLRGVPVFLSIPQNHQVLSSIIEELQDKIHMEHTSKLEDKIILSACKKAVKGNQKLSDQEIYHLIHQLSLCEYPYSCPHGRPTILKMTKYQFEKQFKRIQ
ncbi:MAG: DNA mismatch repair endonuclease MutL [Eubacteriales bacterium]